MIIEQPNHYICIMEKSLARLSNHSRSMAYLCYLGTPTWPESVTIAFPSSAEAKLFILVAPKFLGHQVILLTIGVPDEVL